VSNVTVNPLPVISASSSSNICSGSIGCLNASGAVSYTWTGPCGFTSNQASQCFSFSTGCNCTYSITGVDANGCTKTSTLCITVLPSPTVTAVTSNSIICGPPFPGTATLTANGANSYSWSTSASGSMVAVSPSVTTNYSVVGTSTNGCQSTAILTQSVSACTGLNEIFNVTVNISPNPNTGEFILSLQTTLVNTKMEIYNALGQLIKHQPLNEPSTRINLKEQPDGIYFLKVLEGDQIVYISKVIKE